MDKYDDSYFKKVECLFKKCLFDSNFTEKNLHEHLASEIEKLRSTNISSNVLKFWLKLLSQNVSWINLPHFRDFSSIFLFHLPWTVPDSTHSLLFPDYQKLIIGILAISPSFLSVFLKQIFYSFVYNDNIVYENQNICGLPIIIDSFEISSFASCKSKIENEYKNLSSINKESSLLFKFILKNYKDQGIENLPPLNTAIRQIESIYIDELVKIIGSKFKGPLFNLIGLLNKLKALFPMSNEIILNILRENFPQYGRPIICHLIYLIFMIELSRYSRVENKKPTPHEFSECCLNIIFKKCINIDNEIQNRKIDDTNKEFISDLILKLNIYLKIITSQLDWEINNCNEKDNKLDDLSNLLLNVFEEVCWVTKSLTIKNIWLELCQKKQLKIFRSHFLSFFIIKIMNKNLDKETRIHSLDYLYWVVSNAGFPQMYIRKTMKILVKKWNDIRRSSQENLNALFRKEIEKYIGLFNDFIHQSKRLIKGEKEKRILNSTRSSSPSFREEIRREKENENFTFPDFKNPIQP